MFKNNLPHCLNVFKWEDPGVTGQRGGSAGAGLGVVGLGLMGGSLLRRLAADGVPAAGWDADPATRAAATDAGLAVAPSLAGLVAGSGTVFVAVPLPAVESLFVDLAAAAVPGLVVSDLTSVKQQVRALAGRHGFTFVGGHPMAGTAESGFAAADAGLLTGCPWVLALDDDTDLEGWLGVAAIVTSLGCRVVPCTSAGHDVAVARISHLPHLVAAVLVAGAARDPLAQSLAAGSFRDATRVATTRPELTAAMCGGNAEAVDAELAGFTKRLDAARDLLHDPDRLREWFAIAQAVRQDWPSTAEVEAVLPADAGLRRGLLALGRAGGHVTRVSQDGVGVRTPAEAGQEPTGTGTRSRA